MRIRKGKAKTNPTAPKERINRQIDVSQVRLISETGKQVGVVSIGQALRDADEAKMDLVEISPNAKPPVCKIMDFGSYYYQKERKLRDSRKKQHIVQTKEIKFGPNTEEHDYKFKLHNSMKFLKQNHKVKYTVRFRGRQLAHKDLGYKLLERVEEVMKMFVDVDSKVRAEGRTVFMIVSPKKNLEKVLEENPDKEI